MPSRYYSVRKSFSFDAAHQLTNMPEDHQCRRLHGHTYTVEITMAAAEIDAQGMVFDFTLFKELKDKLDHRNLNDIFEAEKAGPTTSENLCRFIWAWLDHKLVTLFGIKIRQEIIIEQVIVSETPTSRAVLRLDTQGYFHEPT